MKKILKVASLSALSLALLVVVSGCTKTPDQVVQKMLGEMPKVESASLDMQLSSTGKFTDLNNMFAGAVPGKFTVSAKGDMNTKSLESMETVLALDVKQDITGKITAANGNIIYKNKKLFVKLLTVPKLGFFDLTSMKNDWYAIDLNLISDSALVKNEVDAAKEKELRKLFSKTKFLQIVEDKGQVDLDGRKVYDYVVKLNQKEAIKFFKKSTEIMDGRNLTELEISELEKTLKNFENAKVELWIGVSDYRLYKGTLSSEVMEGNEKTVYELVLKLDKMNQLVEIKEPTDAKEFDFAKMFFGGLGASLDQLGNGDILK
jgi:outer membrane lipoprotein-sorting protein